MFGQAGERSGTTDKVRVRNTMQTNLSANSSSSSLHFFCDGSTAGFHLTTAFNATRILLLLPLSILVLYLGHQRWRQQGSFATTIHSDMFTLHMAAIELIFVFGCVVTYCSYYYGHFQVMRVGVFASSLVFPSQICFHVLTCVERYLAVVHPVTYMGLRQSGGVKIRNVSIQSVWLLSSLWSVIIVLCFNNIPFALYLCSLVFALIVVSFCSLCVLGVLIRPRPGEVGGERERVDQSKQRAFKTTAAISGVLWFSFSGVFVCFALSSYVLQSHTEKCLILASGIWFSLPNSLVLPLLFLNRAGKLLCCH